MHLVSVFSQFFGLSCWIMLDSLTILSCNVLDVTGFCTCHVERPGRIWFALPMTTIYEI